MMRYFLILICIAIFFVAAPLHAVIYSNEIPPNDGENVSEIGSIQQAASTYFQLKAEIDLYFSKVEINDFESAKNHLENAKLFVVAAIEKFQAYKESIELTEYQREKYMNYNYSFYLYNPKYHRQVMQIVIYYFRKADIKGFFQEIIDNLKKISETIILLENNVNKEDLWALYEMISNPIGYYGTIVSVAIFS